MKQYPFPKAEHLCLKKEVEALFHSGSRSMSAWPVRVVFRPVAHAGGPAAKVLMSVPKRKLRHAVDRNRAKRQLREAYRHQKSLLLPTLPPGEGVHIGFLWLADRPVPSGIVWEKVGILLSHVAEKLAANRQPAPQPESL